MVSTLKPVRRAHVAACGAEGFIPSFSEIHLSKLKIVF